MSSVLRRSGFRSAVERSAVGDTKTSMVRVDHLGWLVCDGRALLKSEYRALYAVIGDDFSPVFSATQFNLPDAQGRVVGLINTGDNANTDLSGWTDGDVSGEQTHTLTIEEMPSHTHTSNANGLSPGYGLIYRDGNDTINSGTNAGATEPNLVATPGALVIDPSGGSLPHNNIQPTIFMGNLFIYSGQPGKNITGADGISAPISNPSFYPPSTPANRLY